MSERVRPVDLAVRFGITKQAVNKLIQAGMPIDSLESAEAWRMSRQAKEGGAASIKTDKDFNETIEKQRHLKALAYKNYLDDLANGSPDASKSYATYDKLVKTLVTLEKELLARQIASRELIRTQTAIERFGKILTNIRTELTQLGTKIASKANPDHPGRALKAIDEEVNKVLERLSEAKSEADIALEEQNDSEDPVEVKDEALVDDTEPESEPENE